MFVSEIFHSIQGEGELSGVPSVFVRTSGCNLRCRWCDTKYASWEPEGAEWSVAAIVEKVCALPASHVVLTGGEPMIAKDIHALAARLREAGRHITIETAGTVVPGGIACDLASLSPKLRHSTPADGEIAPGWIERHESLRLQPALLREWIEGHPFQLKFVVESAGDVEEIETLVARIGVPIPAHRIHLMPQAVAPAAMRAREQTLIDLCKERGYRYCHRLHIELFGNTRGT